MRVEDDLQWVRVRLEIAVIEAREARVRRDPDAGERIEQARTAVEAFRRLVDEYAAQQGLIDPVAEAEAVLAGEASDGE